MKELGGTHDDASCPGVQEEHRAHQEGAGQHNADGQQEPVSQSDVLLPEEKGVSVWVVEHTLAAELVADGPDTFNSFYKVAGLAKAVQVEGELGKLQRLGSWDCAGDGGGKVAIKSFAICLFFSRIHTDKKMCNKLGYLLRRFSPVVSYLS